MPQGRIISPDFWTDVKMMKLSPFARLFYIGTWNFAWCDQGHLPDDAEELKFKILPADSVDADELLAELLRAGRIERHELPGGRSFLSIPRFVEHQRRDDPRWSRKCPICKTLTTTQEHARGLRGVDRSGLEEEGSTRGARPPRYCSKHPNGTTAGCLGCKDAREKQELWDANKPSHTKRIRKDDPHNHEPDENGYCPTCGEK